MEYPQISADKAQKKWTESFQGLDRRPRAGDGAFSAMGNMVGEPWPLLSSRGKHGIMAELNKPLGLIAMEELAWIDGSTLYYNYHATPIDDLSLDSEMLPKRMVAMGAYLLIFPDKKYYNTADPEDYGDIERLWDSEASGYVRVAICDREGREYSISYSGSTPPENPQNGDVWMDTTGEQLKRWANGQWITITQVYVRIESSTVPMYKKINAGLRVGDNVTLSGIHYVDPDPEEPSIQKEKLKNQYKALNGTHIVQHTGFGFIVIVGIVEENCTIDDGVVRADRKLPEMDQIICCNNRLWGCRYGEQDGEKVNRIYASALGDFRVFQRYNGTSQDSYYVDVGTDGPFTAAIAYMNRPCFFKEKYCHMIYGTKPSDWTMNTVEMEGPEEDCGGTLQEYNGRLIYLSRRGVMMYDSAVMPVGEALGATAKDRYMSTGVGCVSGDTYYLSPYLRGQFGGVYALDLIHGNWYRLDNKQVLAFAVLRGATYMLCYDGMLYEMEGRVERNHESSPVSWYAETAEIGYEYSERFYLRRLMLKMELEPGAFCKMSIMYDGDGIWHDKGTVQGRGGVKIYLAPIVPRRCEHCRVRIEGEGKMRLYGVAREIAAGGDGK